MSRPAPARRLGLPFIDARPLDDVAALLVLLPVAWAIGVDQFVALLVLPWTCLRLLMSRRSLPRSGLLALVVAIIVVQLASAAAITETTRYLTFARALSTYLVAATLVLVLASEIRGWNDVRRVLAAAVAGLGIAALFSVIAASGVYRPAFLSPVGAALPDWIVQTDYGRLVAERRWGAPTWFLSRTVYRTSSTFLFPNTYAVALAVFLPIAIMLARASRGAARLAAVAACLLIAFALVSTTSRTSVAATVLGVAVASYSVVRRPVRLALVAVVAAGLPLMLLVPQDAALEPVETVVGARGFGSARSRLWIYSETLNGVAERPLLGWGTERDATGEDARAFPIGSHSYYLGVAYRHGLLGLALLIAVHVRSWRSTRFLDDGTSSGVPNLRAYVRWALAVVFVTSVTTTHDLDANVMLYTWTLFGVLEGVRRWTSRERRTAAGPSPAR